MNTAVESDDGNAALRARARRALQSWTDRLAKIVAEGIQRKEIEPAVDAEKLARVVIAALEGALLISRLE
ncbi:MAG: TetR family transcriptional regulator C-terminal domain-containing protein, partial [Candidatus Acidiferrum sp.]